ncbi:efflux RND transporter periplasmic adaptor subunit [Streptomyces ficellus]|uniref:efflux RND transporter periplasmic adaptor subunit n=1 Tax=Streptomyces ficellus TaxID=1977088 RepID=UPI001FCBD442|nr:peptidoglycan-binding protein [Streptomyces ficellus]
MTRRRLLVALTVIVVAAGGGAAVTAYSAPEQKSAPKDSGGPSATATVQRGDLTDSSRQTGTLGYAKERRINAGPSGTLTWIAGAGSTIERDERLYEVDGRPVRLMYGSGPMYRTLKPGDEGRDVEELEENLRDLGLGSGLAVDDTYTEGTADAVRRWQESHDLKQTGRVGPDQVAFASGSVRVKETGGAVGDPVGPGKPVLTVTGAERVVRFQLPVSDGSLAKTGTKVTVELPDGTSAPGEVTGVGKTAKTSDDPQDKTPKIDITVSFDDPAKVRAFDQSPVTVNLTGQTRKGVLSVPVNALLALPGGGFGVEVVEGGRSRDVKVELGMFSDGRVEVSGGGLREGMKVGVPSL